MPKKIKLPEYVYKCIDKYGNVSLPKTTYSTNQIKSHLEYKMKCKIRINKWRYNKHITADGKPSYEDAYIAEVVR